MPEAGNDDFLDNQLEGALETAVAAAPSGDGGENPAAHDAAPEAGPGRVRRALDWLRKWHPLLSLGAAFILFGAAWHVYPEPEEQTIPPAEDFYREGLAGLYRVINPDLPLVAATPADEAMAARNALLNLLVFYRGALRDYPRFVNPHLLLAEADFRIARIFPELGDKHYLDALDAYGDALLWETREDDPRNLALYVKHNYFNPEDGAPGDDDVAGLIEYFNDREDEIALRRKRRDDYIRFRQAEARIALNRPDLALPVFEGAAAESRARRRDELQAVVVGDPPVPEPPRRVFELGPDEYARLPLLLARSYDRLGRSGEAKVEYQAFLSGGNEGRDRLFSLGRLAAIAMDEGAVFRAADPGAAARAYAAAAGYYDEIASASDSASGGRDDAVLGSALAYSALANLAPDAGRMVIDDIADFGGRVRSWLESFSGQALPGRTLAIPAALGAGLAKTEIMAPTPFVLPAVVGGKVAAMAGGGEETPYSRRWKLLKSAVARYDGIVEGNPDTELAARAAVMAARECWNLGLGNEAERRFRHLLDPLSSEAVNLAARLGLAEIALGRGDLEETSRLVLGGGNHPSPLWLVPDDADWQRFAVRLGNPTNRADANFWRRIWENLGTEGRETAAYAASGRRLDGVRISRLLMSLNNILRRKDFYEPEYFPGIDPNQALAHLLGRNRETLTPGEVVWRNRLLLEASLPYELTQKGAHGNIVFAPFPAGETLDPAGLTPPAAIAGILVRLARRQAAAADAAPDAGERFRLLLDGVRSYEAALDGYRADPGEILPEIAALLERQAEVREEQGNHREALSLTAGAGRSYLAVASRARGSPREVDSLLSAADAFFRSGLLERAIEALNLFLERFGYNAPPGSETSMAVARAENLLGRSYWFLGETDRALAAFGRNVKRNTPERYKSIYYIGRVMLERAGEPGGDAALLGDPARPLPDLDRDGDPIIQNAAQAFNYIRQDPGITPNARAWRWSAFDSGRLAAIAADRARRGDEESRRAASAAPPPAGQPAAPAADQAPAPWLDLYGRARLLLTEALERYPLRHNGGPGLSVRVEPEDYADLMAARFEAEYMLANALLRLAGADGDESLFSLARAHLANLSDPSRYAGALFDPGLDRFQLNAAVIREAVEGGAWNTGQPLPRTRLGDDEGPTHSPGHMRQLLRNSLLLLANESVRAAERQAALADGAAAAESLYRRAYDAYQTVYDRFGPAYGSQAMLGMADVLDRLGLADAAANHYRMAENIARMQPADLRSDGLLDIGPEFWGRQASNRLRDRSDGFLTP